MAETIFSAVIGDMVGRVISLLVGHFSDPRSTEAKLQRICHMLIKIHSVVEEAKGKQITNHGTLDWLSELIDGMYQGRYLLDTFGRELEDEVAPQPFSLSMLNPAKRVRIAASTVRRVFLRRDVSDDQINRVVENLHSISSDLNEFIMLLQGCRQVHRPLATNIFIEGQMFGRHVEKEKIINFLLHNDDLSSGKIGVLPIVGDIGVGKTTLLQHVCGDARVRSQFSVIVFFNFFCTYAMAMMCEPTVVLRPKHVIGDAGDVSDPLHVVEQCSGDKRFLMVFEDVDMRKNQTLQELLPCLSCGKQGSKIIITTSDSRVATLGTVQTINLKILPCPEYWFFFKAHAFAGADLEENPRLVATGKAIAAKLNGSFFGAKIVGGMLRAHPNPKLWCKTLRSNIGGLSLLGDGVGYIADLAESLLPSNVGICQIRISKKPLASQIELANLHNLCLPIPSSHPIDKACARDIYRADDARFRKVLLCKSVLPFYCLYYTADTM